MPEFKEIIFFLIEFFSKKFAITLIINLSNQVPLKGTQFQKDKVVGKLTQNAGLELPSASPRARDKSHYHLKGHHNN